MKYFLILCVLYYFSTQALSQVILDGKLNEPVWHKANHFTSFITTSPNTGGKPKVNTEVKLLSTEAGIYVGFINYQPLDTRSRKYSAKDQFTQADFVAIAIDFSGQGDTAYEFVTTLGGASMDGVYTRGNQYDSDWEGAWDFKIAETQEYWVSEIFIPWTIVPFTQVENKNNQIRVHFSRYYINQGEQYSYPDTSSGRTGYTRMLHPINVTKPKHTSVQTFPYIATNQDFKLGRTKLKLGADLMWKPSNNQQITAAINPDFGTIESDELVANFSAIETLYTDKRTFFTENQSIFNIKSNSFEMLNTRRIGGNSDSLEQTPAEILAALKYINTKESLDLGVMAVIEDDTNKIQGKNFVNARWLAKYDGIYFGQIFNWTQRAELNRQAVTSAFDFGYNGESLNIDAKLLYSKIKQQGSQSGFGADVTVDYQVSRHWKTGIAMTWMDESLELNDVGYLERNDIQKFKVDTMYTTYTGDDDIFRQFDWQLGSIYSRNSHQVLPKENFIGVTVKTKSNSKISLNFDYDSSGYDDMISEGQESIFLNARQKWHLKYASPYGKKVRYQLSYQYFQEGIKQWATGYDATLEYALNDLAIFSSSYYYINSDDWLINDPNGQLTSYQRTFQQYTLSLLWSLAARQELTLKAQLYTLDADNGQAYFSASSNLIDKDRTDFIQSEFKFQLRYRYRFSTLSDLYIVYARNGYFFENDKSHFNNDKILTHQLKNPNEDLLIFKVRMMF
ncbi:DUF5916 domain-containing protein [Aliikangiella sp. IMCC44359]|uniref:DUF5916 domain-containing protein n=1 Tax=Aliikangiella sp. IMCC44359 TaxID=3459125 RepID=UPI00403B1B68